MQLLSSNLSAIYSRDAICDGDLAVFYIESTITNSRFEDQ